VNTIAKELKSNLGIKGLNTKGIFIILIYIDTITLMSCLDRLLLVITIARAFIYKTRTSITEYL
jgi:hypothetical protein